MQTNQATTVSKLYQDFVVPSYGRFDLVLERGEGSTLWDTAGRRYIDFASGIAVCCLGHANSELAQTLQDQSMRMTHVSNLYLHEGHGRLASEIVKRLAPGKVFFSNSGAEANEGLYKLARKFGHDEGRFEIITAIDSFHGRTLGGIAATGQEKVKKGFEPIIPGFSHVPFNDLEAVRRAITPATVAVLIEGIQGEGGITPATPEYLLGLRALCTEKKLLLMMDAVQCGHYRTGCFHGFQRVLENHPQADSFFPDAISMAKSLGGGFPIGAFWVSQPYADLLGPGTHATTYGGSPLACAVALKVLEVIDRDGLAQRARSVGDRVCNELREMARSNPLIKSVRGFGLMIGVELDGDADVWKSAGKPASLQVVSQLNASGLLTVPAGTQVVRFLPALNISEEEVAAGLKIFRDVLASKK